MRVAPLCAAMPGSRARRVFLALVTLAIAAGASAVPSPLLDRSADVVVQSVAVPSPERRVGEVRVIKRHDGMVVQTLLATKILKRVVAEIRKKEELNWPEGNDRRSDMQLYAGALDEVQDIIWKETMRSNAGSADRGPYEQRMFLEFAADASSSVVILGSFDATQNAGTLTLSQMQALRTLDLSSPYVRRNMILIVADSFHISTERALEMLPLPPLKLPAPAPPTPKQ